MRVESGDRMPKGDMAKSGIVDAGERNGVSPLVRMQSDERLAAWR